MSEQKIDKLKDVRCSKCASSFTYVKKGGVNYKIRCCRKCGNEDKIKFDN